MILGFIVDNTLKIISIHPKYNISMIQFFPLNEKNEYAIFTIIL